MGLNASSNEWCSRSDVVIEGLPWTRKIVDDILVWAETDAKDTILLTDASRLHGLG